MEKEIELLDRDYVDSGNLENLAKHIENIKLKVDEVIGRLNEIKTDA